MSTDELTAAARVWTSLDGRTLRARVLEIDDQAQTVQMVIVDGLPFTLKWEQLSEPDQQLLRTAAQKAPVSESNTATPSQNREGPLVNSTKDTPATQPLPQQHILRGVPMVKQKGNYCVPASAAMIAGFHDLETTQDEVALLSSEGSVSNQGTYPGDMLLAMQKLGFSGHSEYWPSPAIFEAKVLPSIRKALVETGPIYVSFKPGVFGDMGHGCVIIGYDDRRQELTFHNPWGQVFRKKYSEVADQGHGVLYLFPPEPGPVADEAFLEQVRALVPRMEGNMIQLHARLEKAGQAVELIWCSRRDARENRRFAEDTARRDGRKILELAFTRNPAVIIPHSPDNETEAYYLITRPPGRGYGTRYKVYEINKDGWEAPDLKLLGHLTRYWTTRFQAEGSNQPLYELPMIELRP